MHPEKTHIAYCKDANRKGKYPNTKFDFLGYTFRGRSAKQRHSNTLFMSFSPAVSAKALTSMRQKTRKLNYRNQTELSLQDISRLHNPVLRGWVAYYGRFYPSALAPMFRHFSKTLVAWAMRKYKLLKGYKKPSVRFLKVTTDRCAVFNRPQVCGFDRPPRYYHQDSAATTPL
jgi:RNA-directed DNA polymerase